MKILVLGGCGRQGKVIAEDLSTMYTVDTLDSSDEADIVSSVDYKTLAKIMPKYDLVVCALPSHLGMDAIMASIDSSINCVDLSFLACDVSKFHSTAVNNNVTVLHDCGVAPGLSHLVAGRAIHMGAKEVNIYVGGVSANKGKDYIITWSPEDLYEEYIRPARIIKDGAVQEVPALKNKTEIDIKTGLQAYVTDGLRSLLSKAGIVRNMAEYTLRWPGHIDRIKDILTDKDTFVKNIKARYEENNEDKVVLSIVTDVGQTLMVMYGDDTMSAMAKTTALSCSTFAQLLAEGKYKKPGVIPPEDIAINDEAYRFMIDKLLDYGIVFDKRTPFYK